MSESVEKERETRRSYYAYGLRIEALRSDAALDGFAMNEASKEDFWAFVGSLLRAKGRVGAHGQREPARRLEG